MSSVLLCATAYGPEIGEQWGFADSRWRERAECQLAVSLIVRESNGKYEHDVEFHDFAAMPSTPAPRGAAPIISGAPRLPMSVPVAAANDDCRRLRLGGEIGSSHRSIALRHDASSRFAAGILAAVVPAETCNRPTIPTNLDVFMNDSGR